MLKTKNLLNKKIIKIQQNTIIDENIALNDYVKKYGKEDYHVIWEEENYTEEFISSKELSMSYESWCSDHILGMVLTNGTNNWWISNDYFDKNYKLI